MSRAEQPPFVPRQARDYGGAQETKMSAEQKKQQGPTQEEAQKIRDEVGLAPQEVEKINKSKSVQVDQGVALNSRVEKAVNVAAALTTAVAGVGLTAIAQDALRNTPPAIVAGETDPSRDNPSAGSTRLTTSTLRTSPPSAPGVKVEFPTADAPATDAPVPDAPVEGPMNVVSIHHMPAMFKRAARPPHQAQEVKEPETPLYLREFGSPERGVTMRNKVEQGGGSLAYVEMGDQELWNNLLYLRETYGAKDEGGRPLKIEITYYSSRFLWERNRSGGEVIVYWYDVWAGNPGIYKNGVQEFIYRETDKTLDFRITLPEPLPGKVPTPDSVNKMHRDFMQNLRSVFLSQEKGKLTPGFGLRGSPEHSDMLNHPVVIGAEPPNIFNVSRSALWIKLE